MKGVALVEFFPLAFAAVLMLVGGMLFWGTTKRRWLAAWGHSLALNPLTRLLAGTQSQPPRFVGFVRVLLRAISVVCVAWGCAMMVAIWMM